MQIKIAIGQTNPTVGDIEGNKQKILDCMEKAEAKGAKLLLLPKFALCGCPTGALLKSESFIERNIHALKQIAAKTKSIGVVGGFLSKGNENISEDRVMFLADGNIFAAKGQKKFGKAENSNKAECSMSDDRVTQVSFNNCVISFLGDSLVYEHPDRFLQSDCNLFVFSNATPYLFGAGQSEASMDTARLIAKATGAAVAYVNTVGSNDGVVFAGESFVVDHQGKEILRAAKYKEELCFANINIPNPVNKKFPLSGRKSKEVLSDFKAFHKKHTFQDIEELQGALAIGIKDYMHKCGFSKCLLGLSGGIDSAVTCCLAAQAVGAENVTGVLMPSEYSPASSVKDAEDLAKNLGIKTLTVPIGDIFNIFLESLQPAFQGTRPDVTEENLQARIRGTLLMAISNKTGALLLNTGNKSELAMGYCTLYGDMNGGIAVLGDVYKTLVYKVARHINKDKKVIPVSTMTKPPSAELRPNQKDDDTLPPYDLLDGILSHFIEGEFTPEKLKKMFPKKTVEQTINTFTRNEYKRRQAALCIKITQHAFGTDINLPIVKKLKT